LTPDKDTLRKELLRKRDAIPAEVRRAKSRLIQATLLSLPEFGNASLPLLFASFRSEVDTMGIIRHFLEASRPVVVPKVDRENYRLVLREIRSPEELAPGYMGIPEPVVLSDDRARNINEVDAALLPGAGFDPTGARIGYGGGYYDRLLSGLTNDIPLISAAFEEQIAAGVPAESHDVRVKIIVTDRRIIRCTA
jgi:5-formyltetrahydrofolate cyclo-ligase